MKAVIDEETCIGCGLCVQIAPDVYEMREDKATTLVNEIPEELEGEAKEAAEQCPVNAITVS